MILLLLLSAFLNQAFASPGDEPFTFTLQSFNTDSCNNGRLICMGSVIGKDGYLSLTSEPLPDNSTTSPSPPLFRSGRVLFLMPVLAWPASFSTVFTIKISKYPNSIDSGDGMAFIFAPNSSQYGGYGSYLGIMDKSYEGGNLQQLAVEFDTYKNKVDEVGNRVSFDPDGNHVAIDTNSVTKPVAVKSLNSTGVDLKSGKKIKVRIDYDGWTKLLYVYASYFDRPPKMVLKKHIKISDIVPRSVYVGFTAATGAFSESHQLLDWTFTTFPLPSHSLRK